MIFIKHIKIEIKWQKKYIHYLKQEGVPGTHDINLIKNFFKVNKKKKF